MLRFGFDSPRRGSGSSRPRPPDEGGRLFRERPGQEQLLKRLLLGPHGADRAAPRAERKHQHLGRRTETGTGRTRGG